MKILKSLGIVLLSAIVLLVVVSFFLPREVSMEQSVVVDAKAAAAYEQVINLKNWQKWSPWAKIDPSMKINFSDQTMGVGASYSWTSEQQGDGTLTIVETERNKSIKNHLDFGANGEGTGYWVFDEKEDGSTIVTWGFNSETNGIIGKYKNVMIKFFMEKPMNDGLNDIKLLAEEFEANGGDLNINITSVAPMNYLSVKTTCKATDISATLASSYAKIMAYMKKNNIMEAGAPFAIYHSFDPNGAVVIEAGIPTSTLAKGNAAIASKTLPACKAVMASFKGDYNELDLAHDAIDNYLANNNLSAMGAPWEVYVTDPGTVSDVNEIQTDVYYPIDVKK